MDNAQIAQLLAHIEVIASCLETICDHLQRFNEDGIQVTSNHSENGT